MPIKGDVKFPEEINKTKHSIVVPIVDESYNGKYTLVAKNDIGIDKAELNVVVDGKNVFYKRFKII